MSSSTMPVEHGTSWLTGSELRLLRDLLEEQRSFRCEQLDALGRSELLSTRSDTDHEIAQSLIAGARAALRDVLRALRSMDDGSYGSCRGCGGRLPIERLEVLPQVALCTSCQRVAELG